MKVEARGRSSFDSYNTFIRRYHRYIIVAWILALVISAYFIPSFFSSVSYSVLSSGISIPNSESTKAQNILDAQFPSLSSSSTNTIIVVIQSTDAYSNQVKAGILSVNQTIARDPSAGNYTGMQSVYSTEYSLLSQTIPSFLPAIGSLSSNITTINRGLYTLRQSLVSLDNEVFLFQEAVNGTALLVYGMPSNFVSAWSGFLAPCSSNVYCADRQANSTVYPQLSGEALGYYKTFFPIWNSSFSNPSATLVQRVQTAINQTVSAFLLNPQLNSTQRQLFSTVATGLNGTNWYQRSAIGNLTVNALSSQIPSNLTSALGVRPHDLLVQLYSLGPSPSNSGIGNLTISLFEKEVSTNGGSSDLLETSNAPSSLSLSVPQLIDDAYNLGARPNSTTVWNVASGFFASEAVSLFASSPLMAVNSTSLHLLLLKFDSQTTAREARSQFETVIASQSYSDYPYILSDAVTKNFVSANNDTMLLLLSFSSLPNSGTIKTVQGIVHGSSLVGHGTVYVTGSPVFSQDLANAILPAVGTTVTIGVLVSLLIACILFLAPLAALLPLAIAGIAIAVSLAAVEFVSAAVEKTQISFITPVLIMLVMLGLAVDYSALQLKRTREERLNGRSKEDSVAISVRWAGQAVLTAGIAVIAAYVVLAATHIPFFGGVGTAVAIGVSILLGASLTLLPSLELSMGDRLFWPSLHRSIRGGKKTRGGIDGRLERITQATFKRKVAVAVVISLFAAGSLYVVHETPIGLDIIQLLPNFESNQGLAIITNNFGGASVAPTQIIVTTPTPITYGDNQFNQTLLDQIETITSAAVNTNGIVSVTGPTRPFGSPFNYSQVNGQSNSLLNSQYTVSMEQDIGKNNRTALITLGLSSSPESSQALAVLQSVQSRIEALPPAQGISLYYGGEAQFTYDSQSFINGVLPDMIIILAVAIYIILFFQLRSAFMPFQLVFTILCAVVFALALLSILYFHILQLPILNFSMLFVVVTMLGVGTDYDIFLVTRIREGVANGMSDADAIKSAIGKIWTTIFALGLILSSVFTSLIFTGIGLLSELGLTISSAVMLDVVVNILFFVPALMAIASKYNWWPTRKPAAQAKP
jgi:RND superfamily putative drug exporter